jgi:hypothetical protein
MSAIIVHWQKTGTIEAHVETESGTVIRCHDYTAAADATLAGAAAHELDVVGAALDGEPARTVLLVVLADCQGAAH